MRPVVSAAQPVSPRAQGYPPPSMRTLRAILVAAALVLVGAAPASAVTGGFGVAKALKGKPLPVVFATTSATRKTPACQAQTPRAKGGSTKGNLAEQITAHFVPVACEQPPRSEFNAAALKQATAAAMAVLG